MCTLSRRDLTCESSGRCRCSRLQALYIDVSIPPTSPLLLGKGSSLSDACPAKSCTSPLFLGKGSSRFDACPPTLVVRCKSSLPASKAQSTAIPTALQDSLVTDNHIQPCITVITSSAPSLCLQEPSLLPSAGRRRESPPASECRGLSCSTSLSPR